MLGEIEKKTPSSDGPRKEVSDVCAIFKDVTGIDAVAEREAAVVQHWIKRGWSLKDFRTIVEHHFHSPNERRFLDQPGNMNLRMMLNPVRADRLIDVLAQLQRAETLKKMRPLGVDMFGFKFLRIRCPKCLEVLELKYQKVPNPTDEKPDGFKWTGAFQEDVDRHYDHCWDYITPKKEKACYIAHCHDGVRCAL